MINWTLILNLAGFFVIIYFIKLMHRFAMTIWEKKVSPVLAHKKVMKFRLRCEYVDNIDQMVRWTQFYNSDFENLPGVIKWLDDMIDEEKDRLREIEKLNEKAREDKTEHLKDEVKNTSLELTGIKSKKSTKITYKEKDSLQSDTALQNDMIIKLQEMKVIIQKIILNGHEWTGKFNILNKLKRIADKERLQLGELREMLIREIQVGMEIVADLICSDNPSEWKWKKAGNMMIPLFEQKFRRGIMHEILTHIQEFGDNSDKVNLKGLSLDGEIEAFDKIELPENI